MESSTRILMPHPVHLALLAAAIPPLLSAVEEAAPDDIAREVDEASDERGIRRFDFAEQWNLARKRLQDSIGLGWTASYHDVALASLGGEGVPFGASGDFTVQGLWTPTQRWQDHPTELRFRLRYRHAFGPTAASRIGPDIGTLWGLVDGFSDSGFEIPDFYLRHVFERPGIEVRYGQMAIDAQFGGHQLASSKKYFLNQAFASEPGVAFPRFGAGITLMKEFENGLSIGLGATTVQGTQTGDQVDFEFGSEDLFHALQLGYQFDDPEDRRHRITLLGWHSDAVEDVSRPEGEGLQLIYERELDTSGTRFFSTFAWSNGGATPLDFLVTAGFGRSCGVDDYAGIAAGLGVGCDPRHSVQSVFEAFYRWQPRKGLQVSPDIQLLIGEGFTGGPGIRLVAGLRLGLVF